MEMIIFENKDNPIKVEYNKNKGTYCLTKGDEILIREACSQVKIPDLVTSKDYTRREVATEEVNNKWGRSRVFIVSNISEQLPTMKQIFTICEGQQYLLIQEIIEGEKQIETNWIAPLQVKEENNLNFLGIEQKSILEIPFDNDCWVSFEEKSINTKGISHEVTCLYNRETLEGMVVGSITHDTWKTAIEYEGEEGRLNGLSVYGGANTILTRDQSAHGKVRGSVIKSPIILIGCYADWREGLDCFAEVNTLVEPRKESPLYTPIGWNSWGTIQADINYEIAISTSNYIKDNLQKVWKQEEEDIYINLDAFWNSMSEEELKGFVNQCKENGQKAGIYWTPFATWHNEEGLEAILENTNGQYTYRDCVLRKEDGELYNNSLDGAYPLDPTHPGIKLWTNYYIDKVKALGVEYIKLDFLGHGALEGIHYDKNIQTGIQAYNQGMKYVLDRLEGKMFVNLAISPIFPYQYADGRRIACDVFWKISETEYQLNAITYGFWEKKLYNYPDPDHLVLEGRDGSPTFEEARSRVNAAVIAGTSFLSGDDFRKDRAREFAEKLYTNQDIMSLVAKGKMFKPIQREQGNKSADLFILKEEKNYYLAIFNLETKPKLVEIDFKKCGIKEEVINIQDLWTEEIKMNNDNLLKLTLAPKDSTIVRVVVRA